MFAVPEVDDDIENSTPVEPTDSITQLETKQESPPLVPPPPPPPPLPPPLTSLTSFEQSNANSTKIQVPASVSEPVYSKQHRSRRSLFHRNTIHICDQIADRV